MRKLLLTLAVLVLPVSFAAGCGNTNEAASGASELVPAGSVMYGEANLKPEGDQKQAIDSILSKFPGGGEARIGRAGQLREGHRSLARRRGGVLRGRHRGER